MTGLESLDRLRRLDTCAVSDALDQLGLTGVVDHLQPLARGPADRRPRGSPFSSDHHRTTSRRGTSARPRSRRPDQTTSSSSPIKVALIAPVGAATCPRAPQQGAEGTIVDGAVRDVDESDELGYPIYALAATPRTARGVPHEHAWAITIKIGDVTVCQGDYVLADRSGVVIVAATPTAMHSGPREAVGTKEALMAAAIERGQPLSAVMGANYEALLEGGRQ